MVTNFVIPPDFASGGHNVGLTIAKLLEARRQLRKAGVDLSTLFLSIGADQEIDLLYQVVVASTDFGSRSIIRNGGITEFLGFTVEVRADSALNVRDGIRDCVVWAPTAYIIIQCKEQDNG